MITQPKTGTNTVAKHFTVLVCPFLHSLSGEDRKSRFAALDPRWHPWWFRLRNDEQLKGAIDDSYFLLPYMRRLFFPETQELPTAEIDDQLVDSRRLAGRSLPEFVARLDRNGADNVVVRLTLDDTVLNEIQDMEFRAIDTSATVHSHWIDALIFPQNVGFLIWKVEFTGATLTHSDLSNLLYWIRLLHPPKVDWDLPKWKAATGRGGNLAEFESRDMVDFLVQKMTAVDDELDDSLASFLQMDGQIARADLYSATSAGQVYSQVFQLYSYVALVQDANNSTDSLFPTQGDRWTYELATCTDTAVPSYEPHPAAVDQFMNESRIALWRNWQAMALHDNVVFVGFVSSGETAPDARPPFVLAVLPYNVESDYLHLFALVLFQRIWLSMTFGDLIRQRSQADWNFRAVRALWSRFVKFETCYFYSEVTNKPQGIHLYQRFQKAQGVSYLYSELKDQLQTAHDHYDHAVSRRTNRLLNVLTIIGLPIGIATQAYGTHLVEDPEKYLPGFAILLAVLIAGFSSAAWLWRRFGRT